MARFIITTKHVKNTNGIRIEPGMRVEVIAQTMSNPVITNGGQVVDDAFMRIDIKKAGCAEWSISEGKDINGWIDYKTHVYV